MAIYTELFGEYLQANALPSIFEQIDGLADLFVLKYLDKEIGYETEWLFSQKLELKANLVVPNYLIRINNIGAVQEKIFSLTQLQTSEELTENMTDTFNNGAQTQKQTILPFNDTTAEPNSITNIEAIINSETRANTHNLSRFEDLRPSELKVVYDELFNARKYLMNQLLDEFKDLFLKVY